LSCEYINFSGEESSSTQDLLTAQLILLKKKKTLRSTKNKSSVVPVE